MAEGINWFWFYDTKLEAVLTQIKTGLSGATYALSSSPKRKGIFGIHKRVLFATELTFAKILSGHSYFRILSSVRRPYQGAPLLYYI